jgi:hypothetical protein
MDKRTNIQNPPCIGKVQYSEDVLLHHAPFPEGVWGHRRIPPDIRYLGIRQREVSISSPIALPMGSPHSRSAVCEKKQRNNRPCRESKLNSLVFQPSSYTNSTALAFTSSIECNKTCSIIRDERNRQTDLYSYYSMCTKSDCTGISTSENDVVGTSRELQEKLISAPLAGLYPICLSCIKRFLSNTFNYIFLTSRRSRLITLITTEGHYWMPFPSHSTKSSNQFAEFIDTDCK